MNWNFSVDWLIWGVIVTAIGAAIVLKYQWISYNLANGVSSFEKVKLFGVITIIIGLIMMANLHTLILEGIAYLITGGR